MPAHADDLFHPPTSDDPMWTETCWFTFAVPERRLSGQLYPFFRPNQGVTSGGCFLWDESGSQIWNCVYAKNLWHLPIPKGQNLDDIRLANGIHYRCLEPLSKYELHYVDPDRNEVEIHLTYEGLCEPNRLAGGHLDQPGRYRGTIRIEDETIDVDAFGMRDRSWGVRTQIGATLHPGAPNERGGYTYATMSERDAWHVITMDFGQGCIGIHGFLLRDGVWSKLAEGRREVLERKDHCPTRVRITARDEMGRTLEAEGTTHNKIGVHLNPNLWTWNCLTDWQWDGGCRGWGEDHDNWSASAFRRFVRGLSGTTGA
ncbi:MAG TPA: hypothetical protein PLW10_05805 [Myxococcota bacterium]|nr:hypothetical protein [Myxococcales bacterium]HPG25128.1 hypothetical protein [Myxococcota bacterium]